MLEKKNELGIVLAAREYLYLLFVRVFGQEPDSALIATLCSPQTIEASQLFFDEGMASSVQKAMASWTTASQEDEHKLIAQMQSEYTRAMIGPGKLTAYPWESSYVEDAPLLFQGSTLEVRKAFRASGMKLALETNEPEDHLAFELFFMSTMAKQSLEALDQDAVGTLQGLLQQQFEFLNQHILTWIPRYCSDLQKLPSEVYLPQLAQILSAFVVEDKKALEECLTLL